MNFKYRVRASDGNIQEGQLEAESQGLALQALREKGLLVLSMNAATAGSREVRSQLEIGRASCRERV